MKEMNYKDYKGVVVRSRYMNNENLALMLKDKEDMGGTPIAVITVNTNETLPADQAYVKDYSENSGMLEALKESGLVEEILGEKVLGWVTAPLVKFNLDGVDEI